MKRGLESRRGLAHPVQVKMARAAEAEEVFDAISYAKGGSLVRMVYSLLPGARRPVVQASRRNAPALAKRGE